MNNIELLGENNQSLYQEFALKYGTIFHSLEWKKVIESYGHEQLYLIFKENNSILGIFPLHFIHNNVLGKRFMCSLAFSDDAGIIINSSIKNKEERDKIAAALLKESARLFKERHADYIEIKGLNDEFVEEAKGFGYKEIYENYRFVLDISKGYEHVWKNFSKKIRNSIRMAEKKNVSLENMQQDKELKIFYDLHKKTMKRLGTPPHSFRFFNNILSFLKENAKLFTAKANGKYIASILILLDRINKKGIYYASSSNERFKAFQGTNFLLNEAIKFSIENGFKSFDFGVSRPDSGVWDFKKKWCRGSEPVKINYMYKTSGYVIDPREKTFTFLAKIWKNFVPKFVADLTGPYLRGKMGK